MLFDLSAGSFTYGVHSCKFCKKAITAPMRETMYDELINICDDCLKKLAIHRKIIVSATDILRVHI